MPLPPYCANSQTSKVYFFNAYGQQMLLIKGTESLWIKIVSWENYAGLPFKYRRTLAETVIVCLKSWSPW